MDLSILELGVEGKDLRVVIIGNGVVVQDYRQFVDDADCVIRFNLFDLGTGQTGSRTDVLFYTNTGGPARNGALKRKIRRLKNVDSIEEVWFPRSPRSRLQNLALKLSGQRKFMEYGNQLVSRNHLFNQRILYLGDKFCDLLWQKLTALGDAGDTSMPSSGMYAIEHVLNSRRFRNATVYTLGFSHQGSGPHPWQLEAELCRQYTEQGRLKILSGDEPAVGFRPIQREIVAASQTA
ncbi:hypothetical protein [Shewanella algae]|uniref:hypothetical protein n=1 Tax=Shewanella algae TaxID=38313 RepID=UPI0004726362|nr:hypothetical protein [Shewanella algae]MBO2660547.1 hypothetical protein [Shewanella algae]MCL1056286.1 hypothetical protein [Shewanella algae]OXS02767.1 hypothetical protein AMR44_00425 [Shewanella algae]